MEDDIQLDWEGGLIQSSHTVQNSILRPAEVVDRSSIMHSGESASNPDDFRGNQEATARLKSRRTSGSDEEAKRPNGPRRLRWHVSYGKSITKSGSPRTASQDQSSDEYDGTERNKRQRKEWRAIKQMPERADPVTAAKNKASRERQRRERLNDSFVDLSMALDPERSLKAEKTTVIADTIKVIGNIRSENGQLRHEKEQLKEHIAHVERKNKELLFEQDLLKRELDNARQHNYKIQPTACPPFSGHLEGSHHSGSQVVLGVPVHSSASPALNPLGDQMGSVPDLIKTVQGLELHGSSMTSHSFPKSVHREIRRPSLPNLQQAMHHGNEDSPVSESQAIMLGSPSDFFDLDLPITETLADLSKGSSELGLFPPLTWLPPGEVNIMHESVSHAS